MLRGWKCLSKFWRDSSIQTLVLYGVREKTDSILGHICNQARDKTSPNPLLLSLSHALALSFALFLSVFSRYPARYSHKRFREVAAEQTQHRLSFLSYISIFLLCTIATTHIHYFYDDVTNFSIIKRNHNLFCLTSRYNAHINLLFFSPDFLKRLREPKS